MAARLREHDITAGCGRAGADANHRARQAGEDGGLFRRDIAQIQRERRMRAARPHRLHAPGQHIQERAPADHSAP